MISHASLPYPQTSSAAIKAPVAYVVFNRPRHTRKTFDAIRTYRPDQLFIIADGPRDGFCSDIARCKEVREIVSAVDWPCEVYFNLSDKNLGCCKRVSSGLDWVFGQVDRAIILEDDCLASSEFFLFAESMLNRYQNDDRVWAVSGNSYQPENNWDGASYFFSKYQDCWGWATWKRAWQHYDQELSFLYRWKDSPEWEKCFPSRAERRYFQHIFDEALSGKVDSWGYRWTATVMYAGGLSATPNGNLVKNIGFDDEATHTTTIPALINETTGMQNLTHPITVSVNEKADNYYFKKYIMPSERFTSILRRMCKQFFNGIKWFAKFVGIHARFQ